MPDLHKSHPNRSDGAYAHAFRIALLYFIVGAAWIIITELMVIREVGTFSPVSAINLSKGLAYVLITAVLLFLLIVRSFQKIADVNRKLEESQTVLLEAQCMAHVGSYSYDPEKSEVVCTDEILRILGIERRAFTGAASETLLFVHPEERQAFVEMHWQALVADGVKERLFRAIRSDGELRYIYIRITRAPQSTSKHPYLAGTMQDVTDRVMSENKLREAATITQRYLDNASSVFLTLDRNGRVKLINRPGCEMLGMSEGKILGIDWISQFIPGPDQAAFQTLLQEALEGRASATGVFETRVLTAEGAIRSLLWRNAYLQDSEGESLILSGIDITELRAVLDALHESERSKAMLLANLPGMAFRCQPNRHAAMLFVSDGATALTGYQPEDLTGIGKQDFNRLILSQYRDGLWTESERSLREHTPLKYQYEIRTAKGERRWVLETSQGVYDNHGVAIAVEGIVVDITEHKTRSLQVQYMRDHDPLTGIYNRQYFEAAALTLDCPENLPLCIIQSDVSGLKLMNEAFGNAFGDQMIIRAGHVLQECLRPGDLLAKTGGDDFTILAPRTGQEAADAYVAAIRGAVERANAVENDPERRMKLSLTYSIKENPQDSLPEVIRQGERALAQQKILDKASHHNATLTSVMATLYERSFETEEHAERIAALCHTIGERMHLTSRELDTLNLFAMLHDIGKVGISDQILMKPGALDDAEWAEMKKHPEIGYRIVTSTPELSGIGEFILSHHERWDGTGYPRGLRGSEIPLLSRILAVVDAYDAMTEDRVYRKGITPSLAIEEIRQNRATQFDPTIVDLFSEIMQSKVESGVQQNPA